MAHRDARLAVAPDLVDVSALLRDVVESMLPLAAAKGLKLRSAIAEDLTLMGEQDGLIRLFVNLLDNAIKYTEEGEVSVRARAHGRDTVAVRVADTGCGIAEVHLPHLFDRFYRVDESRSEPGAGLGLAIALEIAQAHNGTIEAASKAGVGTVFTVKLSSAR